MKRKTVIMDSMNIGTSFKS